MISVFLRVLLLPFVTEQAASWAACSATDSLLVDLVQPSLVGVFGRLDGVVDMFQRTVAQFTHVRVVLFATNVSVSMALSKRLPCSRTSTLGWSFKSLPSSIDAFLSSPIA